MLRGGERDECASAKVEINRSRALGMTIMMSQCGIELVGVCKYL